MDKSRVERIIKSTRPSAKFVSITHSTEFTEAAGILGEGYFYVNLYDERIDSVLNRIDNGPIYLIHNTYLSSFAYNLYLSLIYENQSKEKQNSPSIQESSLLKYNFKKFFAEQLFYFYNNIFSRAALLESLLYEQQIMIPVFKAVEDSKEMAEQADFSSTLMSSIISFHELGHFFLNNSSQVWNELINENSKALGNLYTNTQNRYPAIFVEEFKCDAISIYSCISQFESEASLKIILKTLVLGFSSFAVMYSLVKSAESTANEHRKIKDNVDFKSIEDNNRIYNFKIGRDLDFIERAMLAIELCKNIAKGNEIDLFDTNDKLTISETILEDLLNIIDSIMETDDINARNISMLAAEAFHNHPEGIEYLYLRSKVFKSDRNL